MKILIAYFSRSGENFWNGTVKNLKKGNTEIVAEFIQKAVGGDLFKIETVKPYSDDYYTCTEEAQAELRKNARPELKNYPSTIDKYDVIFIGYPNWWGTMPMPVFTLLEKFDFAGKKIIPFCTNEGTGIGSSEWDLIRTCVGAQVESGISIHGAEAAESERMVAEWAKRAIELK